MQRRDGTEATRWPPELDGLHAYAQRMLKMVQAMAGRLRDLGCLYRPARVVVSAVCLFTFPRVLREQALPLAEAFPRLILVGWPDAGPAAHGLQP